MNDMTKPAASPTPPATQNTKIIVQDDGPMSAFLDTGLFEQIQRAGAMLAASTCIPESFQGKPADCSVAIALAKQLGVNVVQLMSRMYVVHGKPGIEAQFKIALANTRGPFEGPIDWRITGEGVTREWTAFAKMKGSMRIVEFAVPWSMVVAEGWDKPRGKGDYKQPSKWTTMPEKMGRYRSASYLIDLYCPEVALGMATAEELFEMREIQGERVDTTPIAKPRSRKQLDEPTALENKLRNATVEQFETITSALGIDEGKDNRFYRQNETVDQETGEIQSPYDSGDPIGGHAGANTPGSDGEATLGNAGPITSKASQAAVPPRVEPSEPTQKTVQKKEAERNFSADDLKPISAGIKGVLKTKLENAALSTGDFERGFGKPIDALLMHEVDAAIDFCNNPMGNK